MDPGRLVALVAPDQTFRRLTVQSVAHLEYFPVAVAAAAVLVMAQEAPAEAEQGRPPAQQPQAQQTQAAAAAEIMAEPAALVAPV
jgi:hypothetical protein